MGCMRLHAPEQFQVRWSDLIRRERGRNSGIGCLPCEDLRQEAVPRRHPGTLQSDFPHGAQIGQRQFQFTVDRALPLRRQAHLTLPDSHIGHGHGHLSFTTAQIDRPHRRGADDSAVHPCLGPGRRGSQTQSRAAGLQGDDLQLQRQVSPLQSHAEVRFHRCIAVLFDPNDVRPGSQEWEHCRGRHVLGAQAPGHQGQFLAGRCRAGGGGHPRIIHVHFGARRTGHHRDTAGIALQGIGLFHHHPGLDLQGLLQAGEPPFLHIQKIPPVDHADAFQGSHSQHATAEPDLRPRWFGLHCKSARYRIPDILKSLDDFG